MQTVQPNGPIQFTVRTRPRAVVRAMPLHFDSEADAVFSVVATGKEFSCSDKRLGAVRKVEGGYEVMAETSYGCGREGQHLLFVDRDGRAQETASHQLQAPVQNCAIGRRPVGLRADKPTRRHPASPLGQHFARCARLEAASVTAFLRLHDDLAAIGAPQALLRRVRTAARDEARHTRQTASLARAQAAHAWRA